VFLFSVVGFSQSDTTKHPIRVDSLVKIAPLIANKAKADSVRRAFSPKKATIRSAILPGWGQAYNHKYWKIPIVYGALGTTAAIFLYNLKTYRDLRFAYKAKYEASIAPFDSTDYRNIKPIYLPYDANSLRLYRDEFRSNIDYSVLVFLVFWGLNVVDATVDAHLKLFDVNPDLSFRLKFGPSQMAGTTGLSFVLAFNKRRNYTNF
jgi:hypothetical protein